MSKSTGTDHLLERLVFFSDAVFAIAITLLVIEIDIPDLGHNASNTAAINALVERLPSFFGFLISFLVIGRFWIGHHNALGARQHYNEKLLWPNLMLLLAIAFMPFATAFMSENIGQFVPTLFYNAVMFVTAALSFRLVRIATYPGQTVASFTGENRKALLTRAIGVMLGAFLAIVITYFTPVFSQVALMSIPLWQRLLNKYWKFA